MNSATTSTSCRGCLLAIYPSGSTVGQPTNRYGMRVAMVISSLGRGGGAERVMAAMASYWQDRGWSISVITMTATTDGWYPIPDGVAVRCLNLVAESRTFLEGLHSNARRIVALRRALR